MLWAKNAGGTSWDVANSITVDASCNTYMTAYLVSPTLTFGATTLTNAGYSDIFLTKYDAIGNVLWAKSAGGTAWDKTNSVALNTSGNVYMTGVFISPTLTFGSTTLTNVGGDDIFLAKISDVNGITEVNCENSVNIFPNPAGDIIQIKAPQRSEIEILNIEGQILKTIYNDDIQQTIDLSKLSSGVYLLKAKTDKGVAIKKFIRK